MHVHVYHQPFYMYDKQLVNEILEALLPELI